MKKDEGYSISEAFTDHDYHTHTNERDKVIWDSLKRRVDRMEDWSPIVVVRFSVTDVT